MTRTTPTAPSPGRAPAQPADRAAALCDHAAGAAASTGFALARLALLWRHPAVTSDFGPPLAAAAWPVSLRAGLRHPAPPGRALAAVGGGFLIATAAPGLAIAAHWLRGPTLLSRGSVPAVPAEEVVLAVVVALLGLTGAASADGLCAAMVARECIPRRTQQDTPASNLQEIRSR
jgi:hypothetical protein